eukprot:4208566-Pyramimonas_sp.AAC.1
MRPCASVSSHSTSATRSIASTCHASEEAAPSARWRPGGGSRGLPGGSLAGANAAEHRDRALEAY